MEPVQWDCSRTALDQILTTMRDCFISEWDGILHMKVASPHIVQGADQIVPTGWWVTRAGSGHVTITQEKPVA